MERRIFALCRESPLEVEIGDLHKDLTAEYTLCLEDMTFTMLPSILLCLILPFQIASWVSSNSLVSIVEKRRKVGALVLAMIPLFELLDLVIGRKARAITYIYALSEAVAWLFASAYDSTKVSAGSLSWLLKGLWILLAFAGVLKMVTRAVISVLDSFRSIAMVLHLAKTVLSIWVTFAWLPTCQPNLNLDDPETYREIVPKVSQKTKWVVTLVLFNSQVVYGLAVLTLPSYALSLHATPFSIGLIFGAYSLSILVTSPFFSKVSVTLGRVPLIVTGCVCLALATLLFAAAESIPMLVLSRMLQGIAAAASFTPAMALLTDSTQERSLGETLGEVTGYSGLGMLLGPPLGGLLYSWKGYSTPFFLGAGSSLLVALIVLLTLQEAVHPTVETQSFPLSNLRCMHILGVICIGAATLTMLEPIIPIMLQAKFSAGQGSMALIFGVTVAAFGLLSPIAGKISDKAGRLPVISSGLIFLGSLLPVMAMPNSLILEGVCLALIGAAMALTMVPTLPELADQVRRQGLTSYEHIYALFNSSYAVGSIIGPVFGGLAVHMAGFQTGLLVFAVAIIAYSTGLNWGFSESPKKEKEEEGLLGMCDRV